MIVPNSILYNDSESSVIVCDQWFLKLLWIEWNYRCIMVSLQIVTICCFNCSTIHFGQGKAKKKRIEFAKRWKLPMFQKQGDIKVQTSWKGMAGGTLPNIQTQGTTPSTYPSHPNILPTRIYVWTTKPNVITYCHPKKHPIYSQGKGV